MEKEKTQPKFLIIGSARHGKDTVAELLNEEFGLKFESSSVSASKIFLYDALKDKYGYKTPEECFEDRVNHRGEWKKMIYEYNDGDRARLAKKILEHSDCYVGMRDREEIDASVEQGLFDVIIWVDACERLPKESADSFNIDKSCADFIIDNNGTLEQLKFRVSRIGKILKINELNLVN
jgi:dephospho-CoA kinase